MEASGQEIPWCYTDGNDAMIPVMYQDMHAAISAELQQVGVPEPDTLAQRITRRFCDENAGNVYRVPVLQTILKRERDAALKADSRHMDAKALARKYGIAERHVRRIVGG